MAKDCSFDIVSEVDMQEVDNAVNQTVKEMGQRFDFKGSKSEVTLEKDGIKILADDDTKLRNIIDILQTKCVKRGISLKSLDYNKPEAASMGSIRQLVAIKKGISKEKGKEIVAAIKSAKLKVQAQLQEDQVRVSGKNKDDLQQVISLLKQKDFDLDLQFINFRS